MFGKNKYEFCCKPSSWKSFQSVEIVANGVEPQVGGQTGLIGAQINTLQLHDDLGIVYFRIKHEYFFYIESYTF